MATASRPALPAHSVAPPLAEWKEERVEVQQQHALNCQLTTDAGRKILSVNITHTPHCTARPHTLLSPPLCFLALLNNQSFVCSLPCTCPAGLQSLPLPDPSKLIENIYYYAFFIVY